MAKRAAAEKQAGSVAIFGTHTVGFGFIATTTDGRMFGDGEPSAHRSATAALWQGLDVILALTGDGRGVVSVHMDIARGVPMVAEVKLAARPWFGDLVFKPGTFHVIDAAAIIAAAEPETR